MDDNGSSSHEETKVVEVPAEPESAANGASKVIPESVSDSFPVKVVYNKNKYDVVVESTSSIADFKKQLHGLLGIPEAMQKLMYRGLLRDCQTISSAGISKGAKIMLVGSTLTDVLEISSIAKEDTASADNKLNSTKEPLCKQKVHRKVLDKGLPEDVMPGLKAVQESLPSYPLSGMLNKHGGKVRLTFKMENDQLWLSTKERTEKLQLASIKAVVSEAIEEHEEYHIMGLQLGSTDASRYWIYWVPAQYIEAIKTAVFGQWQF